jgi:hypothetical protein
MYDWQFWTLSESDGNTLEIWEGKILRDTVSPVKENIVWTICTNQRLRWLGHAERMPEKRNVKKVFKKIPEGRRSTEKSRKRCFKMI